MKLWSKRFAVVPAAPFGDCQYPHLSQIQISIPVLFLPPTDSVALSLSLSRIKRRKMLRGVNLILLDK